MKGSEGEYHLPCWGNW